MRRVLLWSSLLLLTPLGAFSSDSLEKQQARLVLEQLNERLHHHSVDIELLHEQLHALEKGVELLNQGKEQQDRASLAASKGRCDQYEKVQESFLTDLKALKAQITRVESSAQECHLRLDRLEKQLSSDIASLKTSLHKMMGLLRGEETKAYTVRSGDSLGQIALDHKTDIKTLKRLNELSSDKIYPGQKLILP